MFMMRCFERLATEGHLERWSVPPPLLAAGRMAKLERRVARLEAKRLELERDRRALSKEVAALRNSRSQRAASALKRLLGREK
jgi:hypothetical protein